MRTGAIHAARPFVFMALVAATLPVMAQDPCGGFRWNVTRERALFASAALERKAGTDIASAPVVRPDHLYDLRLTPQDQVRFALPPGKKMLTDGAYAGIVRLKVASPGSYRVSVDVPFWIDVVSGGRLLPTEDFQGQQGCKAPHKIVEYVMAASTDLLLQFSGQTSGQVHVTVTQAP